MSNLTQPQQQENEEDITEASIINNYGRGSIPSPRSIGKFKLVGDIWGDGKWRKKRFGPAVANGRDGGVIKVQSWRLSTPSAWWNVTERWSISSLARFYYSHLSKFAGIDPVREGEQKASLLSNIFNRLTAPTRLVPLSTEVEHFQFRKLQATSYFHEAIAAYFHYCNPFFPLFASLVSFYSQPRSSLLQLSLAYIGLYCFPTTGLRYRKKFLNAVTLELLQRTQPSKLRPNIDTLQALVVLVAKVEGTEGISLKKRGLLHVACTMVHQLGIFNDPPLSVSKTKSENSGQRWRSLERFFIKGCIVMLDLNQLVYNVGPLFSLGGPLCGSTIDACWRNLVKSILGSVSLRNQPSYGSWELSLLIYSRCRVNFELLLKEFLMHTTIERNQPSEQARRTLKNIHQLFIWGYHQLNRLLMAMKEERQGQGQLTRVNLRAIKYSLTAVYYQFSVQLSEAIIQLLKPTLSPDHAVWVTFGTRISRSIIKLVGHTNLGSPYLSPTLTSLVVGIRFLIMNYHHLMSPDNEADQEFSKRSIIMGRDILTKFLDNTAIQVKAKPSLIIIKCMVNYYELKI